MKPAIRIDHVSKRYRIGGLHPGYMTFREMLGGIVTAPFRKLKSGNGSQTLWALSNINLEIGQGELVGIIGRNGAGKSTLLKVLSRVTRPTTGEVELFGRIGSLLEVGTGFHPDLTGRENIYLSGTILGMRKREIDRQFDEIVAFAEVEPFVDTPVKRYSSGMYVRLAFAIAAHLDTEILLMDEVLAVGDAEFQKKCLGKMDDVAQAGRTIVFVSHNMAAVQRLCGRGVLLNRGMVAAAGPIGEVVKQYLDGDASPREAARFEPRARSGLGWARVTDAKVLDESD